MDTTTLQQMLNYLTPVELWQKVDPPKAGWYIAAIRSNDVAELYSVREVWFNPSAPHKWWDRCDHGHSCQSWIGEKVVAWRELPKFDKANPLALGF